MMLLWFYPHSISGRLLAFVGIHSGELLYAAAAFN